jgi:transposase
MVSGESTNVGKTIQFAVVTSNLAEAIMFRAFGGKKIMESSNFKFSVDLSQHIYYCGLDVHKHEITAVIYASDDSKHEFTKECIFNTDTKGFKQFWNFVKKYNPHGFVMEATGIYHHVVVRFLEEQQSTATWSFDICVINPSDAAALPGHAKNDKIDAKNLARYFAKGLLVSGKIPLEVMEDLKAIFRMGLKIEHQRTTIKNRIKKVLDRAGIRPVDFNLNLDWTRALLVQLVQKETSIGDLLMNYDQEGHPLYKFSTFICKAMSHFEPYSAIRLSAAQRMLIRQNLVELDFQTSRKILLGVEVDKILLSRPGLRESAALLNSIPGISSYGAVWILAEIGNFKQFKSQRAYLSYCGCCPNTKATANKVFFAHTNRHSNQFLRTIFTQAAQVICNLSKKDSELKKYATRILAKKGIYAPKLAYSIIAAKVCKITYAVVRDKIPFQEETYQKKRNRLQNQTFTVTEMKDLRRARNNLRRVAELNNIGLLSSEVLSLAEGLDAVLTGKKSVGLK